MSYKKVVTHTHSHIVEERIDNDHKDMIIKQLKAEINELKNRENDYFAAVEDI